MAETETETAAAMEQADATATAASAAPPEPKKKSRRQREGTIVRTIKVDFDQSAELSDLISRHMDQQRWAFNMAVKKKLDDPRVAEFDLNNMLTKLRDETEWLVHDKKARAAGRKEACNSRVQRAGLMLGLDAVKKFMASNGKKRSNKSLWKYLARLYREREGIEDVDIDAALNMPSNKWSNKKNKWRHNDSLFKRKGKQRSLSVFVKPTYKGNGLLHLPGIGAVKVHGDVDGLDMLSFQLVETTKRTTKRTESHNRTYRLHIQVEIKAPKPSKYDTIRGVDMGIVHGAATVDLDTGRHAFHDLPKDCRRAKNDDISRMYSELSQKRGGRGNRRTKQDSKEGSDGGSKSADGGTGTNGNGNTSGNSNANNTRGHKKKQAEETKVKKLQGTPKEDQEKEGKACQPPNELGEARVQEDS